ncbi:MAG: pyrroline-5-carboxylate reductase [Firmicutes bacterium]|nr:pyrroline-5-carboxylate reductase [Bacillota bacterium]
MIYGFLGAGNMASAIIRGMVKGGFKGEEISVYNTTIAKSEALSKECGVDVCLSQKELIEKADVLVLSVKPQVLDKIADNIKIDLGGKKKLIISIAVGKTLEYLENALGNEQSIVRVMPNINAKVLASCSGFCTNKNVSAEEKAVVENIFSSVGSITEIPESQFSIFGVVAGSSPAFAYLYIDSLARAAVKAGMPKEKALRIAAHTVLGSAKMVMESAEHPWELVDMVCSPGGTTIEGICSLETNGFESTIHQAFDAVLAKDKLIQSGK